MVQSPRTVLENFNQKRETPVKRLVLSILGLTSALVSNNSIASCIKSETSENKLTNHETNELSSTQIKKYLDEQIDDESFSTIAYFYKNKPDGNNPNRNNGLQCLVFNAFLSGCSGYISNEKLAYFSLNRKCQELINAIGDKLRHYYLDADGMKKRENHLQSYEIDPCAIRILDFEELSIRSSEYGRHHYPWCWRLDSYKKFQEVDVNEVDVNFNHASKCTSAFVDQVSRLFDWLSNTAHPFEYIAFLPAFLGNLFNTIFYYTRIYDDLLNLTKREVQSEESEKDVVNMIIQSGFKSTTYDIKCISNNRTINCLRLEQKLLAKFALELTEVIFNKFVRINTKGEIAGLFNYKNYVNDENYLKTVCNKNNKNNSNTLGTTSSDQVANKCKQDCELALYCIYINCQKICRFLPRMVSFDPDINKKQEYYYSVLNKSYIAEKAVGVFKNELWSIEMAQVQIKNNVPKKQIVQSKVRRSNLLLKPDISIPASKDYKPQMFVTKKMVKQIGKINGKKGIQFSKTTHPNHTNSNETKSAMKGGVK